MAPQWSSICQNIVLKWTSHGHPCGVSFSFYVVVVVVVVTVVGVVAVAVVAVVIVSDVVVVVVDVAVACVVISSTCAASLKFRCVIVSIVFGFTLSQPVAGFSSLRTSSAQKWFGCRRP